METILNEYEEIFRTIVTKIILTKLKYLSESSGCGWRRQPPDNGG
jgi:hypothetical protein